MRIADLRWSLAPLMAGLMTGCADQPTAPGFDIGAPQNARVELPPSTGARTGTMLVTGPWSNAGPHVKVFDGATTGELTSFFAYAPSFTGGVRVAVGDVNGDGHVDVITGAGPGAAPHVKVFDGATGVELMSFFAFDAGFSGGVFVAAGDVDGDGHADIVVGAGAGGAPHVKVFSGATGALLASFLAYPVSFGGGVSVAAGDVNGDGHADIVTGAGAGGAPHVKAFSGATGDELASFLAYPVSFSGGVFVAAGDVDGDGHADIVTGAGAGGAPHVKAFSGATGGELVSFLAYAVSFDGGVSVAAGDVDGDGYADIVTGAGAGGGPHVKVFSAATGAELSSFFAYDVAYSGGVFVAAGDRGASLPPTIQDILDAARQATAEGILVGDGRTAAAAAGRLAAWLHMLEEARALIEAADIAAACHQLEQAYLRADGRFPPPDFVSGSARGDLVDMILWLREALGCGAA